MDQLALQCGDKKLSFRKPAVMGVLNLTPDSFYDGGQFCSKELALARVDEMIAEGADIIDVGAESSRPFAKTVSLQEEIERIGTILVALRESFNIVLSVDTYKSEVMREAIRLGVNIINDIYALRKPGALSAVAGSSVAVILMHMQNNSATMQLNPFYDQVVSEVGDFLESRVKACMAAGIEALRIAIDPGFGFGKNTTHNMQLLKNLAEFKQIGCPILVGLSRKASIGEILSLPVEARLYGSLSAHVIAVMKGASIIRTHDIKPTVEAIKIAEAVLSQEILEWQ